jgi:hypothetical protein
MAGPHAPLSTLHVQPRGRPRMTRGRCGSLLLHRGGLSPPVSCRSPDAPNRSLPSKAYRNIPSGEPDESLVEVVQVLDPRHPLYGRSFRVICRSSHRGGNFPPSYEVEHRDGTSLLVPISATEPYGPDTNRTKLSIEALCELISAVECLECDEHRSERSVGGAATGSTATDRGRHRRDSGGDVS